MREPLDSTFKIFVAYQLILPPLFLSPLPLPLLPLLPPLPPPPPQLRAPGSPVIIVGTCLDLVSEQRAKELERIAMETYSDTKIYPKVMPQAMPHCIRVSTSPGTIV